MFLTKFMAVRRWSRAMTTGLTLAIWFWMASRNCTSSRRFQKYVEVLVKHFGSTNQSLILMATSSQRWAHHQVLQGFEILFLVLVCFPVSWKIHVLNLLCYARPQYTFVPACAGHRSYWTQSALADAMTFAAAYIAPMGLVLVTWFEVQAQGFLVTSDTSDQPCNLCCCSQFVLDAVLRFLTWPVKRSLRPFPAACCVSCQH